MGILVVSFVVWGVADAFRSNGLTVVATVGNTDIPVEQFQTDYNRALQQLGQQMGRPCRRRKPCSSACRSRC